MRLMPAMARVLLSFLVLMIPGVWIISALVPQREISWRWIQGSVLGVALGVYLAQLCGWWDIRIFYGLWLAAGTAGMIAWRKVRGDAPLFIKPSGDASCCILVLLAVAVSRVGVASVRQLPSGWDPCFHVIFVRKIMLSNALIADWQPFESLKLNYPLGAHLIMALMAKATGLEPHTVFNYFSPILGVLTTAMVYSLTRSATGSGPAGIWAALAYGMWAWMGSISYQGWGGLPNALAMIFLLMILQLLIEPAFRGSMLVLAVLCAAMIFTHHHVMVTAIGVLGMLLVVSLWKDRLMAIRLLKLIPFAFIASSFFAIPYLLKARGIGGTSVFKFVEESPLKDYPGQIGYIYFGLMVCGVAVWSLKAWTTAKERVQLEASETKRLEPYSIISLTCLTLIVLYALTGHLYPIFAKRWFGYPYVAFTPSRFITDMVCIGAVFAGYGLARILEFKALAKVPMFVFVCLGIGGSACYMHRWEELCAPEPAEGRMEAYEWIRNHTPENAVIYTIENWAPYLSWRKTMYTPVPISEPQVPFEEQKARVERWEKIRNGMIRAEAGESLLEVTAANYPVPGAIWAGANGIVQVVQWVPPAK
jgi:hypothetical protein